MQEKTSTTISWGAGWIKKAARMKLAFLLALSGSACRVTGESRFLAVHGGQCLRLSMCWLVITSSSCASKTVTSTPVTLNLRPAWDFPASFPEEGDTSFSLLFRQTSDMGRIPLCLRVTATQRKAQQWWQGRRMQQRRFVLCKGGLSAVWHLQIHNARGDTHTVQTGHLLHLQGQCPSREGAEPAASLPVFMWYLCHWEQPETKTPGGSRKPPLDLLFPNFPFLLFPVLKSSSASWS